MTLRVLTVNPGSTSTKVSLFEEEESVLSLEVRHDKETLAKYEHVLDQLPLRRDTVRTALHKAAHGGRVPRLSAVVGRGGLLRPMSGGIYSVNDAMIADLRSARFGEHASNLGALLAREYSLRDNVPALVVDPVVTDEMRSVARVTGLPWVQRRSVFHALSQRGAARAVAREMGLEYERSRFIVAHMGGGISIGAHDRGRVVDVINALDGEGPFSPERVGSLPLITALGLVLQQKHSVRELQELALTKGGLWAHMGTNDLREVLEACDTGDEKAALVFDALSYNIAKHVSSLAPALLAGPDSRLDGVVLTGGLSRSSRLVASLRDRLEFLAPVSALETDEMRVMAEGAWRVLRDGVKPVQYTS
ncbi:butyrate kinase [Paucidesulfovibrio gracilis DSM 16080]|uniref:Probable butyrate kinase n=1 Tax=Paucidesulfovibrio gracilis DSM 16080 TaxID=1121449 RepID=A0A1T4WL76_9BACT|nr:butyrate kinase [Paucidesulfovibrio gracilis]SKA78106.1 butyrate kinase [Paucidesulfovibrio gracilis DSM 16080]